MDHVAFENDVWESINNSLYTDLAGSMEDTGIVFTVGETWLGTLYGTEENEYGQRAVYMFGTEAAQRDWFDAVTGA